MKTNKIPLKKIIHLIGSLLVILSFYYLAITFNQNFDQIKLNLNHYTLVIFLLCLILGLISYAIMAYSWFLQVKDHYPIITLKKSIAFIGLSQIAKYLPGNIGHVLARGIMLKKYMKTRDITLSFIVESLCMAFVSGCFAIAYMQYIDYSDFISIWQIAIVMIGGTILTIYLYRFIRQKYQVYHIDFIVIAKILSLFVLLSLSAGLTIVLLTSTYDNIPKISYWQYVSGFAFAFVVGFIMPGAPAGIGVREALFVILFGTELGEQVAMEIILIIRLLTLVGDATMFSLVYLSKSYLLK